MHAGTEASLALVKTAEGNCSSKAARQASILADSVLVAGHCSLLLLATIFDHAPNDATEAEMSRLVPTM